jgi:hypothetical protein
MPDSEFKIVTGGGDWGSPLGSEATFDSLEEAQAAAREYLTSQRQSGGPGVSLGSASRKPGRTARSQSTAWVSAL